MKVKAIDPAMSASRATDHVSTAADLDLPVTQLRPLIFHGLPARGDQRRSSAVQVAAIARHWTVLRASTEVKGKVESNVRVSLAERIYRQLDYRLFGGGKWAASSDSGADELASHDGAAPTALHLAWRREVLAHGAADRLCVEYEGLPMAELEQAVRQRIGQPGGMLSVRVWLLSASHPPRLLFEGRLRLDHRSLWRSIVVCAVKLPDVLRAACARRDRPELALQPHAEQPAAPLSAARQIWRLVSTSLIWTLYREQWQLEVGLMQGSAIRPLAQTAVLRPPDSAFWADPFLLRRGSRTWVLFEELPFATNRGHISALEIDRSGRPIGETEVVLREPWHLSFPFLWHEGGRDFMIPESANSRELALYEFVGEGKPWRRRATLVSGMRLADASVVRHEGRLWMFATGGDAGAFMDDALHVFWADAIEGPWHPHALNPVKVDASSSRPAGSPWVADGTLYRAVQDCSSTYGSRVRCMRVVRLTPEEFDEETVEGWAPLEFDSSRPWHTFNTVGDMFVIDRLVRVPRWRGVKGAKEQPLGDATGACGVARYSRHGLHIAEQWLDDPPARPAGCDVLLLHQYSQAPKGAVHSPFATLTLDLSQEADALLQGLNRDTKYKVRRAEGKDEVVCIQEPEANEDVCRQFVAFYNEFAQSKGLSLVSGPELAARARAGALRISRAVYRGETVVWHVHAATAAKATLLHSASHFRNLDDGEVRAAIGRANRLLHWKDILSCKEDGLSVYDFGGWYAGSEDEALLKINQFKEGFGGVRTEQVNAALALTWRGSIYLRLRQRLSPRQRKQLRQRMQALLGRTA